MIPDAPGSIRVGDPVEVLDATAPAETAGVVWRPLLARLRRW